MRIIGLCKTNTCSVFLKEVLREMEGLISDVVFVHSDINWLGENSGNEVYPEILNLQKDYSIKLHNLWYNTKSQIDQTNYGYNYIKKELNADWILVFDTDEFWEKDLLKLLIKKAENELVSNSFSCQMKTYIKYINYLIDPPEPCAPTVMVRPVFDELIGIRGNGIYPKTFLKDCYFHHYSYVRKTEKEVFKKIQTSTQGDNDDSPGLSSVNLEKWKNEKWDKLPYCKDFHTSKGYEDCWKSVRIIPNNEIPKNILNLSLKIGGLDG